MKQLWLQKKFAGQLASRLTYHKVKSQTPYLANFRCPICNDSAKNKFKTRGYIYESKGSLKFKCHNCAAQHSFSDFLKETFPEIFSDYLFEYFQEKDKMSDPKPTPVPTIPLVKQSKSPLFGLQTLQELPETHLAVSYVAGRKIPISQYHKLYYVPEFKRWANSILPGKFKGPSLEFEEERLLLPFINRSGECFGVNARALDENNKIKYFSLMFDKDNIKVFGLDTVDFSRDFYCFEGPIDSFFVDNSFAMAGSDFNFRELPLEHKKNLVICYDNEPRNKEIVKKIANLIYDGFRVFIWPWSADEKVDINKMILNGVSQYDIMAMIKNNTYHDLAAQVKLNEWKKI